jgi:capsular polysaccharide transport system ATP-binding protein
MIKCINICKDYPSSHGTHHVLKGVNLTIAKGEKVGLLGRNGAGKTTLVKLIGGVELPTRGLITRKMSISWPIGFNGGFQGSLTGYDNARFISRVYDRKFSQIKEFIDDFTELADALKQPVKTYSSGMRARLAFGLSLAIDFECYLIDEVILVGDQSFQRKCQHELFEKRSDRAMVIISHDMVTVAKTCDRGVVIHEGRATTFDQIDDAVAMYGTL